MRFFLCMVVSLFLPVLQLCAADDLPQLEEVRVRSTADRSMQPAVVYLPEKIERPVPLLVVLHTWSGNYRQKGFVDTGLAECRRRGWALAHPDFRGPNRRPEACASAAAKQDVLDAVDYVKHRIDVDPQRIYLVGASGGGHMALVMAAAAPKLWASVSAWVPISDLAAWHAECAKAGRRYSRDLEDVCGGAPGDSDAVDRQYRLRSPLPVLARAAGLAIDINTGIDDGHTGSVPVSHSLRAFNVLADANALPEKKLTAAQIDLMTTGRKIPKALAGKRIEEPGRKRRVLFRRQAGPARLTVFEGGHEGDMTAAIAWLADQSR